MDISILWAGIISAIFTLILAFFIKKLGEKGKAGNLYSAIRGGTPRAVGLAPFIVLLIFLTAPFNYLIGIMGFLAFLDDLSGRTRIPKIPIELGQLCRGLGILLVVVVGYPYLGIAAVVVALMIQPLNIADMQPGSACSTVIIMSSLMVLFFYLSGYLSGYGYYPLMMSIALITLAACIGYAPLDYKGRIMMGEVGNHSFAVALGITFALWGGIWATIGLLLVTTLLIAFIRRKNLKIFLEQNLEIQNPVFGDYFMDVLTGGGLGDLLRRFLLRDKQIIIKNSLLATLGFRRLFYNPHS